MTSTNNHSRRRKRTRQGLLFFNFLLIAAVLTLFACTSLRARNTESLLSAAGFTTMTPRTPQQRECYNDLPAYTIQRREANGKVVYAFADKKKGILYVGGEPEYQKFKQLAVQQKIANDQLQAAQMNQNAALHWDVWGPPVGMWW